MKKKAICCGKTDCSTGFYKSKDEKELHLQCRFLEDLTAVDEAKIQSCTNIYDRLKFLNTKENQWKEKENCEPDPEQAQYICDPK
jgi:hypothetical protein